VATRVEASEVVWTVQRMCAKRCGVCWRVIVVLAMKKMLCLPAATPRGLAAGSGSVIRALCPRAGEVRAPGHREPVTTPRHLRIFAFLYFL